MSILELAKADIEQITSNADSGFARAITFTAPDATTVTVNGLHTKHHLALDTDGNRVNAKNAHVSISEKVLTDLAYPVRDSSGEVKLRDHKVSVADSSGTVWQYVIREAYPDETVGLTVCILGDFE